MSRGIRGTVAFQNKLARLTKREKKFSLGYNQVNGPLQTVFPAPTFLEWSWRRERVHLLTVVAAAAVVVVVATAVVVVVREDKILSWPFVLKLSRAVESESKKVILFSQLSLLLFLLLLLLLPWLLLLLLLSLLRLTILVLLSLVILAWLSAIITSL